MARKKAVEVMQFAHVAGNEVFEPIDWPEHFFVPRRTKLDISVALRVKRVGRHWLPFDERPLHAELGFFPPDEPSRVVGNYK
jgi:hypothetical protein